MKRVLGRVLVASFVVVTAAVCERAPTMDVTIEQARAAFCGHGVVLAALFAGGTVEHASVEPLLRGDAALYELAGGQETAEAIRELATSVGPTEPTVRAYVEDGLTEDELETLDASLVSVEGAVTVEFLSKEEAYERFVDLFADEPSVVENTDPDVIPASFDVVFAEEVDLDAKVGEIEALVGVRSAMRAAPDLDPAVLAAAQALLDEECPGLRGDFGGLLPGD